MANAIVTSDSTKIKVVFNDLASAANRHTSYFKKSDIVEVYADSSGSYVTVVLGHNQNFDVSLDGAKGTILVDSIDGATPANNGALCDTLGAFIL